MHRIFFVLPVSHISCFQTLGYARPCQGRKINQTETPSVTTLNGEKIGSLRDYACGHRTATENPRMNGADAGCHSKPGETLFQKSASLVSHCPTLEFCHIEQFPKRYGDARGFRRYVDGSFRYESVRQVTLRRHQY